MFAHPSLAQDHENAAQIRAGKFTKANLAGLIDSTILKPDSTPDKIQALCKEAVAYGFRSVCVPPSLVGDAASFLRSEGKGGVLVCTVIGFPNGYSDSFTKIFEISKAVASGADELDFVQNVGWVKAKRWDMLGAEYAGVMSAAGDKLVKVILETSLLTEEEIRECTLLAARKGVHVIKTSTGFGSRGASERDIEIIAAALAEVTKNAGTVFGIKASGGVRSNADAQAMIAKGATRLGTSGGAAIVDGAINTAAY